ncbi:MAG: hypothetical protein IPP71_09515 [Bacteroidetes bacterium]|nr:hypothetical protein [Bacteroidota bacterium]
MKKKPSVSNIAFQIVSFESVGPINFGMKSSEIDSLLGPCEVIIKHKDGGNDERRFNSKLSIKYNFKNECVEVSLEKNLNVMLSGISIFKTKNLIEKLSKFDNPVEKVGFVIFFKLGIALTGFGIKKDDKTISVFSKENLVKWKI